MDEEFGGFGGGCSGGFEGVDVGVGGDAGAFVLWEGEAFGEGGGFALELSFRHFCRLCVRVGLCVLDVGLVCVDVC